MSLLYSLMSHTNGMRGASRIPCRIRLPSCGTGGRDDGVCSESLVSMDALQCRLDAVFELCVVGVRCLGVGAYDVVAGQLVDEFGADGAQSPFDEVAGDGVAYGFGDDKAHARGVGSIEVGMDDQRLAARFSS